MKISIRRAVYWLPAVAWIGVIFYFSGLSDPMPGVEDPLWKETLGRFAHAGEYAGLTFWFLFGWTNGKVLSSSKDSRYWMWSPILAVLFGIMDELHQIFVPGRSFQILDLLIDSGGAGLGAIVTRRLGNLVTR